MISLNTKTDSQGLEKIINHLLRQTLTKNSKEKGPMRGAFDYYLQNVGIFKLPNKDKNSKLIRVTPLVNTYLTMLYLMVYC